MIEDSESSIQGMADSIFSTGTGIPFGFADFDDKITFELVKTHVGRRPIVAGSVRFLKSDLPYVKNFALTGAFGVPEDIGRRPSGFGTETESSLYPGTNSIFSHRYGDSL